MLHGGAGCPSRRIQRACVGTGVWVGQRPLPRGSPLCAFRLAVLCSHLLPPTLQDTIFTAALQQELPAACIPAASHSRPLHATPETVRATLQQFEVRPGACVVCPVLPDFLSLPSRTRLPPLARACLRLAFTRRSVCECACLCAHVRTEPDHLPQHVLQRARSGSPHGHVRRVCSQRRVRDRGVRAAPVPTHVAARGRHVLKGCWAPPSMPGCACSAAVHHVSGKSALLCVVVLGRHVYYVGGPNTGIMGLVDSSEMVDTVSLRLCGRECRCRHTWTAQAGLGGGGGKTLLHPPSFSPAAVGGCLLAAAISCVRGRCAVRHRRGGSARLSAGRLALHAQLLRAGRAGKEPLLPHFRLGTTGTLLALPLFPSVFFFAGRRRKFPRLRGRVV
jgi:hypothetical protein